MSWKSVMNLVRSDDRFYEETDENGEPKPAGWQFLQADDGDGEEGDEEDDGDVHGRNARHSARCGNNLRASAPHTRIHRFWVRAFLHVPCDVLVSLKQVPRVSHLKH